MWSTYYGNNYPEQINDKSIVSFGNEIYLAGSSPNETNITTPNSYQETNLTDAANATTFLVKFDSYGVRQWGTMYGYQGTTSRNSRITKDLSGNVFLSGTTGFTQNISSLSSYQEQKNSGFDSFVAKFSLNGDRQWGTYYGGNGSERENIKSLTYNDSFYIVGSTNSTDNISTPNSYQPNYSTNIFQSFAPNNFFIAKFDPIVLSANQFSKNSVVLFPNPTSSSFAIKNAT